MGKTNAGLRYAIGAKFVFFACCAALTNAAK
jgi:hypothetical protein